jgi:hypothetical protein
MATPPVASRLRQVSNSVESVVTGIVGGNGATLAKARS